MQNLRDVILLLLQRAGMSMQPYGLVILVSAFLAIPTNANAGFLIEGSLGTGYKLSGFGPEGRTATYLRLKILTCMLPRL